MVLVSSLLVFAATQTISTLPVSNSAFLATLQAFLRGENAARFQKKYAGYVLQGGYGATSGTLAHTISAITAFPYGYYVYYDATAHTYTANTRTFVYVDYDNARTITIAGAVVTRVGNLVFAEMAAGATEPVTPVGCSRLMQVDTSGVAITTVADLRSAGEVDVEAYGTIELADANAPPCTLVLTKSEALTANVALPVTIRYKALPGAILTTTGYTFTPAGGIEAGRYQIFAGTGTVVGLREAYPEWWGAVVGDNTVDSGVAWNNAIVALDRHGRLNASNGVYYASTGILVDEKPISIIGDSTYGTVIAPKSGLAAWTALMTVNSTVRGAVPNWWTTAHNNGFTMKNVTFEGGGRDYQCHGLVFTGKNSDVRLSDIFFANIKGSGMKACDPFGATYDDASTGNYMQQCQFENIRFQNCGYEATGGTASENFAVSHAAYEIGRNEVGTGSHNHLKHVGAFQLGYPRWRGIRVLNRAGAGTTGPNIHELAWQDLFLHGTVSLSGNDENGDAWNTTEHLMTIGNIVADGESSADTNYNQGEIKAIEITNFHVVEMEPGYAGIVVGECWNGAGDDVGASVYLAHGQFGADSYLTPSYGVLFDGAESSYVGGITYHSAGGPANSVYVKSLLDTLQEITLGPMTAEVPVGTPAASATVYVKSDIGFGQIHDLTMQTFTVRVPAIGKDAAGDTDGATGAITGMTSTEGMTPGTRVMISAGFASTGPYTIVEQTATSIIVSANSNSAQVNVTIVGLVREFTLLSATPDYRFIRGAWIVPEGALTADDTDYAELIIGYRNNAGAAATGSPVTTTTKTAASGGTGDFSAFVPIELDVDRGVAYLPVDGTVTFEIDQVAAGVATPAMLVGFETSDWKYYQDPP